MDPEGNPAELRARQRVGQVLRGKWRLDRLIGVGGMAAVYAATHRNGKRGAVKLLHVELSAHEGIRRRFLREGYAANTVDHPGAVSVLDDDTDDDGSVFLVMELLQGQSLDSIVGGRPNRALEVAEALAVGDALTDVLAAAHEKGIVHRDLKPENLFVTKRGELKVLDFGIARLLDQGDSATATKTGTALGTPAFMPPEQALGNVDQIDARTDLWSAGATLFALLTGRPVHSAPTLSQVLLAAMTQPAPSLAEVLPSAPPGLVEVVDRSLRVAREERWQNATAMQAGIRALRQQFPGSLPQVQIVDEPSVAPTIATPVPTGDRSPSGGSSTEFASPAAFPTPAPGGQTAGGPMQVGGPGTTPYPAGPTPGTTSGVAVAEPAKSGGRGLLIGLLAGAIVIAAGLGVTLAMQSGSDESGPETKSAATDTGAEPATDTADTAATSAPDVSSEASADATEAPVAATASEDAGAPEAPTATAPAVVRPTGPGKAPATSPATAPKATATSKAGGNPLSSW